MGGEGEVGFAGFPIFGDLHEDGGDQAFDGVLIGKETCDTSAAFDLAVKGFAHVGGAKAFTMGFG